MDSPLKVSNTTATPCAACKLLRRRCAPDCLFAPYFPADEPHKFASVHRVFGASNVNKLLQQLHEDQRADAVSSMVYESNARIRDPIYGCVGTISCLQQQVLQLQTQLAVAQAETVYLQMQQDVLLSNMIPTDDFTIRDIEILSNPASSESNETYAVSSS